MKKLLILRHAKSSKDNPSLKDYDRPLNDRGFKQSPLVGQFLKKKKITPGLILSSKAVRDRQTAEIVAKESGYQGELILTDKLYEAKIPTYIQILQKTPEKFDFVMLVGHNPAHEEFVNRLVRKEKHLSTAALAQIHLPIKKWKDLHLDTKATLVDLWQPDVLPAD